MGSSKFSSFNVFIFSLSQKHINIPLSLDLMVEDRVRIQLGIIIFGNLQEYN